ncbi:hypothetical protein PV797_12690 [Clostridiaceae bacterium M8S5]|nr:hypothetical protein PV797_12690 [Clostridiaceae bacterium M8S5]
MDYGKNSCIIPKKRPTPTCANGRCSRNNPKSKPKSNPTSSININPDDKPTTGIINLN